MTNRKAYLAWVVLGVVAFCVGLLLAGCADSGAYRSPRRGGPGGGWYGVPTTTTTTTLSPGAIHDTEGARGDLVLSASSIRYDPAVVWQFACVAWRGSAGCAAYEWRPRVPAASDRVEIDP